MNGPTLTLVAALLLTVALAAVGCSGAARRIKTGPRYRPGETIRLTVAREGEEREVSVELEERRI